MKKFFSIKQGGVLGRNLKHQRKIKIFSIAILFLAFSFSTMAYLTSDIQKNHYQASVEQCELPAALLALVASKFIVDKKFKELTGEELETFKKEATPEQLGEYYKALSEDKETKLKALIEAKATKEEVEALRKEFNEAKEDSLKAEVIRLAGEVKSLKENGGNPVQVDFKMALEKALMEKKEALTNLKNKQGGVSITLKAAGTITTANVTPSTPGGISGLLNTVEPGITPFPRVQAFFRNLFTAIGMTGQTVSYAEMKNPDGGAAMTAEGGAKSKADFDIVEATANAKKITAYIKTSKEALDDITALAGEINTELVTLVNLKADSQLMIGDGTGNNLNGAITQAEAFTGGDLAGTIVAPNNYDVLVAAITEIAVAEVIPGDPAGFMANVIVLNPVDVAAMKLTKDENNNYIFPVTLPGATAVMEVPVVSHPRMTKGDFLVMDSTKGNLRMREDITLDIGYENDDFTKNLINILAEMRLAFYIKSNHVKAFLTGDFESAKALLQSA